MRYLVNHRTFTFAIVAGLLMCTSAGWASVPTTQPSGSGKGEKDGSMSRAVPMPKPELTPDQVVKLQLDAMKRNDDPAPDSGIATAFKFASPENREQTGPLDRFTEMVKSAAYAPMLNAKSVEYSKVEIKDDQARQVVKVIGPDGEVALYVFILGKQAEGEFKDCWMTEGVMRVQPEDAAPTAPVHGDNGRQKA